MYKIAICDDLPNERETLHALTSDYFMRDHTEHEIAVFESAKALLRDFDGGRRFDIYMLDILMPEQSGMELAKKIREQDDSGVIVFITATADYAVDGYAVNALDYIVKPTTASAVDAVLARVAQRLTQTGTIVVNIKSKYGAKELKTSDIVRAESRDHYVFFHMSDGSVEQVYASMEDYGGLLTKYAFFARCHKSNIVNLNYVDKMKGADFYLKNGSRVGISRKHLDDCRDKYQNHIFAKGKVCVN